MNKSELVAVLGSQKALADLLGITPSAVSQWPEDLPELRIYQVREKLPDIDRRLAKLSREPAA